MPPCETLAVSTDQRPLLGEVLVLRTPGDKVENGPPFVASSLRLLLLYISSFTYVFVRERLRDCFTCHNLN